MIKKLVFDIDGVFTNGSILYNAHGKSYKIFGPHDKDGIKIIRKYINDINFITADTSGWDITYARFVKDWKIDPKDLILVPEESRLDWFLDNCEMEQTAFMGDGYYDAPILSRVKIGICPGSGRIEAQQSADYVTQSPGGNGAVLDACLYLEKIMIKNAII